MKIAVQTGLNNIMDTLKGKGYTVVPYRDGGTDIKVTIINDVDEEYEEIEPVSFMGEGDSAMVVIDATKLSQEQVVQYVEKYAPMA